MNELRVIMILKFNENNIERILEVFFFGSYDFVFDN